MMAVEMSDSSRNWQERIHSGPESLGGKPVIRGTRISVALILELLAAGQAEADILNSYPGLEHDDILACLSYATHLAQEHRSFPIPA